MVRGGQAPSPPPLRIVTDPDEPPTGMDRSRVFIEAPGPMGLSPARWDALLWSAARQLWPSWRTPSGLAPKARRHLEASARRADPTCPAHPWPALAQVLGAPDLEVFVHTPELTEASADVTSRTLEAAQAQLAGAALVWRVRPQAREFAGVIRSGGGSAPLDSVIRSDAGEPHRGAEGATAGSGSGAARAHFFPIEGRPHPASPAELALYRALQASHDLQDDFRFNEWVETSEGAKLVDAVSPRLGLAVEVDGFRFHHGRAPFARDRHRDFLLTARGWRVLRLTHEEIMADVHRAVDKIRALADAPKEPEHDR